ncbi:MAG: hypothetical protein FWC95_06815, partial [Defluviitaleaceae bacterium]|nr:hypothetical protein [Defluviitaleaceae bacterium]
DNCVVRLLACEGAPPCCAVGSACGMPNNCNSWGSWGGIGLGNAGWGSGFDMNCGRFNPMGGVVVIPFPAIAAFVHHAI